MKLAEFIAKRTRHDPVIYLPCMGCDAGCSMSGITGEPCWGRVLFEPEYSDKARHLCAGHSDPNGYKPRPDDAVEATVDPAGASPRSRQSVSGRRD